MTIIHLCGICDIHDELFNLVAQKGLGFESLQDHASLSLSHTALRGFSDDQLSTGMFLGLSSLTLSGWLL